MATKNIIAAGIGFTPNSVKFIVTRGLSIGAAAAIKKLIIFAFGGVGQAGLSDVQMAQTKLSSIQTKQALLSNIQLVRA